MPEPEAITVHADGTGSLPEGTPVIVDTKCPCGKTMQLEDHGWYVALLCPSCRTGMAFTKGVVVE